MTDRLLISANEAAALLDVHPDTVYAMAARGELPYVRIGKGRNVRFSVEALRAWARERSSAPTVA